MSGLLGAPRDVPVFQNDAEIEGDADPSTPAFTSSDLGAKQGVSATIAPQIIGVPGLLGAPREVPVWRNDAEIEGLAKFAVEEHNKKENALLEFARVVKAKEQTVVGTLHHLTIEAVDAGKKKIYEAQVWVKSWENFKQLKEFNHVGDADPSTPPEWQGVPLWARVSPSYSGIPYVSSFYLTRGEPPEGIKMEYVRGVGRPAGFVHSEFDQAVLDQMRAKKEMIDMEFRARFPNGGCRWCHQEVTHSRLVCPVGKKLVAYPLPQACVRHA